MNDIGSYLAQARPGVTSATTAITATMRTEIKKIVVCNVGGGAGAYSIYHDDDGTTYDQTTALFYSKSLAANTTDIINAEDYGGGISVSAGGAIGIQSATASAMTFTFYGTTQRSR
jgi:hypothetical protein